MTESQLEIVQRRRYYQNEISGKKHIVLALHGYGQLAQYFYRKFQTFENDYGLVIPEGPHRFYLEGSSGRAGASWMTKEWREQDISDNTAFLINLTTKIKEELPNAKIHLIGFSQGGATAARLYQAAPSLFSQLILWASVFPPDIEKKEFPKSAKLDFAVGENDPYFTVDQLNEVLEAYQQLGFETHVFNGKHDINQETLGVILKS